MGSVTARGPAASGLPASAGRSQGTVTVIRHGSASIVQVTGDVDATGARHLDDVVTRLLAAHPAGIDTVIIDLSRASTLAAAGAAVLHSAAQQCRGRLTIRVIATGLTLRMLQLTGASDLTIHPGLEDALAAGQATEPDGLACTLSVWPAYVLITVAGECDLTVAPQLRDVLLSQECQHAPRVIVSLAALTFLDSAGLRTLLSARTELARDGTTLAFAAPRPAVARILALTGVDQVLQVHGTLAEATAVS
jgi:anti-sigma B factor antagonist